MRRAFSVLLSANNRYSYKTGNSIITDYNRILTILKLRNILMFFSRHNYIVEKQ